MKNIHLLKTDKPTGIFKTNTGLEFSITNKVRTNSEGFHIYITSDEEIKEEDWTFDGENPYKWTSADFEDCLYNLGADKYKGCKKIILTTDETLIKDGIQEIDDEFLKLINLKYY